MPSAPLALAVAGLLVIAGAAFASISQTSHDGHVHEEAAHDGGHASAPRSGHGHGGGAHEWSGGAGTTPTLTDALTKLERRSRIVIQGDEAFNPANGVRGGSGTYEDPFVISGWHVDQMLIADTSKAFEIKENYVSDILILDWTGQGGYVHHNHLDNLRTNRNVARTGDPTAAVLEKNLILEVEELRHFDGEVRNNTIGDADALPLLGKQVVLNIAGLNGAGIHDNLIHGGVDMKIHGHHHSDKPGDHSHNHGQPDEAQQEDHFEDHQVRYVDFRFYGNRIVDDGFGLRYNDLNHAGDDRQATSEQEPDLEKPHVHHTTITLENNTIEGATLRLAVVNSPDERHLAGEEATVRLLDNKILRPFAGDGIVLQDVHNALVVIEGNTVEKKDLQLTGTSAIFLQRFENSTILVHANKLGSYKYGVRASEFDAKTNWTVADNDAPGVDYPAYWDESVPNAPRGQEEAAGHEHGGDGHAHEAALAPRLGLPRLG